MLTAAQTEAIRDRWEMTLADTCQIISPGAGEPEDGYNPEPDWTNPTVTVVPCRFDPGVRVERRGPERTVVQTQARFWVPDGTAVTEADRIYHQEGATDYTVTGVPPQGTYSVGQAVDVEAVR